MVDPDPDPLMDPLSLKPIIISHDSSAAAGSAPKAHGLERGGCYRASRPTGRARGCAAHNPPRAHRVGVRFPRGRTLLPFYADFAEDPTFTILLGFWRLNFYHFTIPPKISLQRAARAGHCATHSARLVLPRLASPLLTLACLSHLPPLVRS